MIDMSVPTDNNKSVKQYNKINLENKFKTWGTLVPVIVGALSMIKKEINTLTR